MTRSVSEIPHDLICPRVYPFRLGADEKAAVFIQHPAVYHRQPDVFLGAGVDEVLFNIVYGLHVGTAEVDDDEVCLLSDSDIVAAVESHRPRPAHTGHFQHLLRVAGRGVAQKVFLQRGDEIHLPEHVEGVVAGRAVGADGELESGVDVPLNGGDTAARASGWTRGR